MRTTITVAALLVVTSPLAAQKVFEGSVTYRIQSPQGQGEMVIMTKGSKVRTEVRGQNAQGAYYVMDYSTGDMLSVMPSQRKYVSGNLKQFRDMMHADQEAKASNDAAARHLGDIVDTGRQETIAGVSCEVYRHATTGDDGCIATGLGHFIAFEGQYGLGGGRGAPGVPSSPALANLMRTFKDGALVLRVTMGTKEGRPTTMVATKVERTSLPASLFAAPAGYAEIKSPMAARP